MSALCLPNIPCFILLVCLYLVGSCSANPVSVPFFTWTDQPPSTNVVVTAGSFSSIVFQGSVYIAFPVYGLRSTASLSWSTSTDGINFSPSQTINNSSSSTIGGVALAILSGQLFVLYPGGSSGSHTGQLWYSVFNPSTQSWSAEQQVQGVTNCYQGISATLYAYNAPNVAYCLGSTSSNAAACYIMVAFAQTSLNEGYFASLYNSGGSLSLVFQSPLNFYYPDGSGSGQATWSLQTSLVAQYDPKPHLIFFQNGGNTEYFLEWYGNPTLFNPPTSNALWTAYEPPSSCSSNGEQLGTGVSATILNVNGCQDAILLTHLSSATSPTVQLDFLYAPLNIWTGPFTLSISSTNSTATSIVGLTPEVLYFNFTAGPTVAVYWVSGASGGSELSVAYYRI